MDIYLSKDAKKLMRLIYREYKRRLRAGVSEIRAVLFEELSDQPTIFRETFKEDYFVRLLSELGNANLIKKHKFFSFTLVTAGIVFMQHRYDKWKNFIAGFVSGVLTTVVAGVITRFLTSIIWR
jgi:hypothetical protein